MNAIDKFSQFTLKIENTVYVTPSLSFTLYLDTFENHAMIEFYHRALEALNGLITHYIIDDKKRNQEFSGKALTTFETWFKRPGSRIYWMHLHGVAATHGVTPAGIDLVFFINNPRTSEQEAAFREKMKSSYEETGGAYVPAMSQVTIHAPVDHELATPARFCNWVQDLLLVKDTNFISGVGGYLLRGDASVGSSVVQRQMEQWLIAHLLRHPGFDYPLNVCAITRKGRIIQYQPESNDLLPLIKRVNWLTLVNKKSIDYLGGLDAVKEQLGADLPIIVHELKYGVLIQAGPAPAIGDTNHRDFLPIYRRVAKVLRLIRIPRVGPAGILSFNEGDQWLEGLDKDYD